MENKSKKIIEQLLALYREVDGRAERLKKIHAGRLNCKRGCSACCVDGITVFAVEAENIKQNHPALLAAGEPQPAGRCAFLDSEGACRIYEDRPYVCRTQGLPLRWLEEDFAAAIEYRDICPLNEAGEPVEALPEDQCWSIGDFEARLAGLQAELGQGLMERIALRDLFLTKNNSKK